MGWQLAITEQLTIPEDLGRELAKTPQGVVRWERVSRDEWRLIIVRPENEGTEPKADPVAAIGFAQKHGLPGGTTDEWMRLIRGDDWNQ